MFSIHCPYCGNCDAIEFSYGGDASRTQPQLSATEETWFDYVYLRTNPRGEHEEFWQHIHGCRQWLRVRRDTLTHAISACRPANKETGDTA